MIHNCLECKKINYIFKSDLKHNGEYQTILNTKEYIFSYPCFDCSVNNMLFTNIFDSDYSINLFLYEHLGLEIKELNLDAYYTSNSISKIKNLDELLFHKVIIQNNNLYLQKTEYFPQEDGEYIITFRDETKKLNKLYSIKYEKSKLILF